MSMASRLEWITMRRAQQLSTAAADGQLYYDDTGRLRHRTTWPTGGDPLAHPRDAQIVTDLIAAGRLRRDESGAVTTASDVGVSA